MPRTGSFVRGKFQRGNQKASNAAGYAKRKASKPKVASNASDIYEYSQEKVRRSKVKLLLEKDEIGGAPGEQSDGEAEEERGQDKQPRLVGENDDDEGIADEDDEDIDSDAAFDDSDEERFAGFEFSHKKVATKSSTKNKAGPSKAVHFAEVDLNEESDAETPDLADDDMSENEDDEDEEEEEEEGDPSEFIDVLDILDGRGEPDSEDDADKVEKKSVQKTYSKRGQTAGENSDENAMEEDQVEGNQDGEDDDEDSKGEDDEDEDDEEEEDALAIEPDDAEVDDSALQNLETFIGGLDAGTKRKAPEDGDTPDQSIDEPKKQKRRILKEQTQGGAENEFAALSGASKLNLDDLLAPLASSSSSLQSLKKSAKVLASTSSKAKTLAAPLPQRAKERLDREAAYEQTKEEIDKWSATIKRIKEAEHLSFPLQAAPASRTSNLELTAKFKPTTELESAVDKLLKTAKMREQDITQTETLKMNHLSIEEVAARRAELAKTRELIFRSEAKAKRIAKIKSKTYRRIRKKQKDKLAAKLGELSDTDPEDEEERMKHEVERARERATLRHKNTGKWAKAMRGRGELDEDERMAIGEMLDRGEKLRRRIQGEDSGDESGGGDEDDESGEEGEDAVARIKASAFDELAKLREEGGALPEASGTKGKSVFEMKFMKDAMLRDKAQTDKMADDFMKELVGELPRADSDGEDEHAEEPDTAIQRVGGRVSFRPANAPTLNTVPSLASDTSSVTLKSTDLPPHDADFPLAQATSPILTSPIVETETEAQAGPSNPWLAPQADIVATQKKHEVVVSKNSAGAEKSKNKLRKRARMRAEEQAKAKEDASVDIEVTNVLSLGAGPSKASAKGKGKQRQAAAATADDDGDASDANSELDEQEKALEWSKKGKGRGVKAFEQRDLVARAFAGDNVVQDFEEAKRREIQEDAPTEVDTTLAGWGSWGGAGTKKAPPKPYLIKKVAGVDPKSRADFNKAHVIISEKRDKKAAKYLVKDLPYPYTSRAQFERSMDTPIGAEWNTRVGFQRGTLPKVTMKPGSIITPLEKLQ